ncbi:MAG: hypothetical protein AAF434_18630 [Pseudomonadota bacterium]
MLEQRYEIIALTPERYDETFALATRIFVANSSVHKALEISLEEYRNYYIKEFELIAEESLSLVSIDSKTGLVAGCLIGRDYCTDLSKIEPNIKLAPLSRLIGCLEDQYKKHRQHQLGACALVDIGAVDPEHEGHGIYRNLRTQAHSLFKTKGYRYVVGELSSSATQHVLINKMGHREIANVAFADFTYNGSTPFASIEEPPTIVMVEGEL